MNLHLPRLLILELTIIATAVIAYFAGNLIATFGQLFLILAFAILLTYALLPAVNFLAKYRFIPRGLAILLVYIALIATVVGGVALVSVPLANQGQQLAEDYPRYVDEVKTGVPRVQSEIDKRNFDLNLNDKLNEFTGNLEETAGQVANRTGDILAVLFGTLSTIFIVFFVSIYFLLSGASFSQSIVKLFPKRRQRMVTKLATDYNRVLGSFVRGQLLISLIIAIVVSIFALVIGLPYSVLIGVVAGITSLIPTVGVFLGIVLPVIISAFVNPILIPVFIIFFLVLNEVSDKILYPRIVGRAVELHPLIVFFGILVGVQVAGVTGALLATPVLALAKVTIVAMRKTSGNHPS